MSNSTRGSQPTFAWSQSRHRRFQECQRKHFLAVYQSHGGWREGADPERRLAWTMGKLIPSWATALGTVVHRSAIACVRHSASGRTLPSFDELRTTAGRELNQIYRCSRDRLSDFWRDPVRWPVLAARFYDDEWRGMEMDRTRRRLDDALRALLTADELWADVRMAGAQRVWIPQPFFAFTWRPTGTLVYAAPDVVVRPYADDPAEIWDFKLGHPDGVIDQLLVYAVALREATSFLPSSDPHARYLGRVIHLNGAATHETREAFAISDVDLEHGAEHIGASTASMYACLRDVARNIPLDCDSFPRTVHRWRCGTCQFRGLCAPDQFPLPALTLPSRKR